MNITIFWLLFLGLWGIVPLMILKGRTDKPKLEKVSSRPSTSKKGWFK